MNHSTSFLSSSSELLKSPASPAALRKQNPEYVASLKRERTPHGGITNAKTSLASSTPNGYSPGGYLPKSSTSREFPNVKPSKERLLGDTQAMRSIRAGADPAEKHREGQAMESVRRKFNETWAQRDHYERHYSSRPQSDPSPVPDDYWPAQPQSRFQHTPFSKKDVLGAAPGSPSFADKRDRFTTTLQANDLLDCTVEKQVQQQKDTQRQREQQRFQRKQETEKRIYDALEKERSERDQAHFEARRVSQAKLHAQYLEGVARREAMQGRLYAIVK